MPNTTATSKRSAISASTHSFVVSVSLIRYVVPGASYEKLELTHSQIRQDSVPEMFFPRFRLQRDNGLRCGKEIPL